MRKQIISYAKLISFLQNKKLKGVGVNPIPPSVRFFTFSCLSDVSPTDLGMLSFYSDSKFWCPFLLDFRNL